MERAVVSRNREDTILEKTERNFFAIKAFMFKIVQNIGKPKISSSHNAGNSHFHLKGNFLLKCGVFGQNTILYSDVQRVPNCFLFPPEGISIYVKIKFKNRDICLIIKCLLTKVKENH